MSRHEITVNVNGKTFKASVDARMTLLDFLRTKLNLTGTHIGCEHGICGACSVTYDTAPVRSCLLLAVQANGKSIGTVEGLRNEDGSLSILQDAFYEAHAMQCGYCIPGILISADSLLKKTSNPTLDEIKAAIGGNLCRCTGYVQIIEAIQLAAQRMQDQTS